MHPEIQHKHVIVRAELLNPPTDAAATTEWLKQLVADMGMEILIGPHVVYLNDAGNRGITGLVGIKTSSFTVHIWDEQSPGILQGDFYTCGHMDLDIIFKALQPFDPVKVEYKYIDRQTGLNEISSGVI